MSYLIDNLKNRNNDTKIGAVVFSAGFHPKTKFSGQHQSMASMMATYLEVVLQNHTGWPINQKIKVLNHKTGWTTLGETMAAIDMIEAENLPRKIIVFSSQSHLPRIKLIWGKIRPDWEIDCVVTERDNSLRNRVYEFFAKIKARHEVCFLKSQSSPY